MTNLTRYENDGIELVIDNSTGEAFATLAGYARMANLAKNALANRLSRGYKGVHKKDLKTAEIQTAGGLQGVHIIPADIIFDWLLDDNTELARAMGKAGATVYLHQLAGYKIESTITSTNSPQLPQTYLEALKALVESEEEKERLKAQTELQAAEIDELEEDNERLAELTDELFNYSSIIRVAKLNGVSEKSFKWRTLKAATKIAKLEVRRVPCPRFGEKLLYPHEAWTIAYPEAKLPENPSSALTLTD